MLAVASCASPAPTTPSPTTPSAPTASPLATTSGTPHASAPPSVFAPTAAPSPNPVASAPLDPPYGILSGHPTQEPGTILFGDLNGNTIAPFAGYPLSFTIDRDWGFGAYFGRPVDGPSVSAVLVRQKGDEWLPAWTTSITIAPDTTGVLAMLPKFEQPGIYRLDVMLEDEVLASSLMSMVPPCEGVCTGG
jgi:hypothetical protein